MPPPVPLDQTLCSNHIKSAPCEKSQGKCATNRGACNSDDD